MPNSRERFVPPDQFDIEEELTRIIQFGDRKPIATWGSLQYDDFCKSIRTDNPTRPAIFDAACVLYGARMHDHAKARAIWMILYRLAEDYELTGAATDILQQARVQLQQITEQDIKAMSDTERVNLQVYAGDLRNEASTVHDLVMSIRRQEMHGRPIELQGNGIKRA